MSTVLTQEEILKEGRKKSKFLELIFNIMKDRMKTFQYKTIKKTQIRNCFTY